MASVGEIKAKLSLDSAGFSAGMTSARKSTEGLADSMAALKVASSVVKTALFDAGAAVVKLASDLAETGSAADQVFSKSGASDVKKWADEAGAALGRSSKQMLSAATGLQSMLSPMVNNKAAAAGMSKSMAQLAIDLGSFFNASDKDALAALKSGLTGQEEPLQKFGVVMNEAALKAFALKTGVRGSYETMDTASKTALRYAFILSQTKDAQGDAARTGDGFANQVKRLEGNIEDLGVRFGNALLPAVNQVALALNSVADQFKTLSPETIQIATAVAGFGLALVGVTSAVAGLSLAAPAIAAFGVAFTTVVLPILAVAAALGVVLALVSSLKYVWDQDMGGIKTAAASAANYISQVFRQSIENVLRAMEGLIQAQGVVMKMKSALGMDVRVEAAGLLAALKTIEDIRNGDPMKQARDAGVIDQAKGFADVVGGTLKEVAGTMGDTIASIIKAAMPAGSSSSGGGGAGPGMTGSGINVTGGAGKGGGNFVTPEGMHRTRKDWNSERADIQAEDFANRQRLAHEQSAKNKRTSSALQAWGERKQQEAAEKQQRQDDFKTGLGNRALGAMGPAGGAIGAGIQGAAVAGPMGAIAGIGMELLTASSGFKKVAESLNGVFQMLSEVLTPICEVLLPVIQIISAVLRPILEGLSGVFKMIAPIMKVVGVALMALFWPTVVLGKVFNLLKVPFEFVADTIYSFIEWLFDCIADIVEIFDEDAADSVRNFGRSFRGAAEEANAEIVDAFKVMQEVTWARLGEIKAISGVTKAAQDAASALTNVPVGFKIAAARFRAISNDGAASRKGGPGGPGGVDGREGVHSPGGGNHQRDASGDVLPDGSFATNSQKDTAQSAATAEQILKKLPGFARGGHVDRTQVALLHGGETVIRDSELAGMGGGGSIVLNFYGITDTAEIIRTFEKHTKKKAVATSGGIFEGAPSFVGG